jgi:DNA-binding IclR family transcriptional regulator
MATAASNPTLRVVAVLDHLTEHSNRPHSLSDLSRALGISKSTLHPLIESLVQSGYLLRADTSRMVQLGPTLAGIGHAALGEASTIIEALRPFMEQTAAELDAHCIVSGVFEDWIVPMAATGDPSRVTTVFRVGGKNNPFEPPMGVLFVVGQPMRVIQEWLSRPSPPLTPAAREASLSGIDVVRANGFAAATRLDVKGRLENALDGYANDESTRESSDVRAWLDEMRKSNYLLLDLDDRKPREIDWIGVPVTSSNGRVRLALVVLNLPRRYTGPEVTAIAHRLREGVRAASESGPSPAR